MRIAYFALGVILLGAPGPAASQTARAPQLFAFHSNFWVNLHHFLYATARARKGMEAGRAIGPMALADTAGVGALAAGDRAAWDSAVAYYESTLVKRDLLFDSTMVAINNTLATMDDARSTRGMALDPGLARALDRAAPVYRALWWPRHDAANHAWIGALAPLIARDGSSIAANESRLFREAWPPMPVRVDVTAYSSWAGAYTTNGPPHITISSTDAGTQGAYALETVFHEVLHTMDDTLFDGVQRAFRSAGKPLPHDPTHPFIFFTAGELTRRVVPGHVPFAEQFGLWNRVAAFRQALAALHQSWALYLTGALTFDEALSKYAAVY